MNFKVKCVEDRAFPGKRWFTLYENYEICDGKILDNDGYPWRQWAYLDRGDDIDKLNDYFIIRGYRFELVSEDTADEADEPKSEEHDTEVDPIKEVNFDKANLTTTIVWKDGTTTKVVTMDRECWNEQQSFVFAYCKRLLGNDDTLKKAVMKWVIER